MGKPLILFLSLSFALLFIAPTSSSFSVNTQSDWNKGSFNSTTADRRANSGILGLGYLNGTASGQPIYNGQNSFSLTGYWRFDTPITGSNGDIEDYSGYNNKGTTKGGISTGSEGILTTNAFKFDGGDDYVDLKPSSFPDWWNGNPVSVSVWFKTTDNGVILGTEGADSPGGDSGWVPSLYIGDQGKVHTSLFWHDTVDTTNSSNSYNDGNWHHAVATYESGTEELYIDGKKVAERTGLSQVDFNSGSYSYFIGSGKWDGWPGTSSSVGWYDGSIDEPRVYDRKLDSNDVKSLYLEGKPLQGSYTSETFTNTSSGNWTGLEIDANVPVETSATVTATSFNGGSSDQKTFDLQHGKNTYSMNLEGYDNIEVKFEGNTSSTVLTWEVNSFKVYKGQEDLSTDGGSDGSDAEIVNVEESFSSTSKDREDGSGVLGLGYLDGTNSAQSFNTGLNGPNLTSYYRLDRSLGSESLDYSGKGNDGTPNGGLSSSSGVFSTDGYSFNGQDSYVDLPQSSVSEWWKNEPVTVSAWFKTTDNGVILGTEGADSPGGDSGWVPSLYIGDSGKVHTSLFWHGDTETATSTNTYNDGNWHHVTATYNSGTERLYIDGSKVAERTGLSQVDFNSGSYSYFIGSGKWDTWPDASTEIGWFEGEIDEFRFYDRELSSGEISDLYFNGNSFKGQYTKKLEADGKKDWDPLRVDADIKTGTDLTATVKSIDSTDTTVDQTTVNIQDGNNNYNLNLAESEKAEIQLNGDSNDASKTWEVYSIEYGNSYLNSNDAKLEPVDEAQIQVSIAEKTAVDITPEILKYEGIETGEKMSETTITGDKEKYSHMEIENIGSTNITHIWVNSSTPEINPFGTGISSNYDAGNFIQVKSEGDADTPSHSKHYYINRKEFNESNDLSYIREEQGENWRYGRFRVGDQELFWAVRATSGGDECTTSGGDLRVGKEAHNKSQTGSNDFTDGSGDYNSYSLINLTNGEYVAPEVWINTSKASKKYDVVVKCGKDETWTLRTKYNVAPAGNDLTGLPPNDRSIEYLIDSPASTEGSLQPGEYFSLNTAIEVPNGVARGNVDPGRIMVMASSS